jgi:hypothetical protein
MVIVDHRRQGKQRPSRKRNWIYKENEAKRRIRKLSGWNKRGCF